MTLNLTQNEQFTVFMITQDSPSWSLYGEIYHATDGQISPKEVSVMGPFSLKGQIKCLMCPQTLEPSSFAFQAAQTDSEDALSDVISKISG